jgi:hypothetical protein
VKQNNWQLSLVFNTFIFFFILLACLTLDSNSNSQIPHFGLQQNSSAQNSFASAKAYRPDSFNRIYDNRNRLKQLQELQLATKLVSLYNLQLQIDPELAEQNLAQKLPADYNPFAHGDLSEFVYGTRVFINTKYREAQEIKFPYLANLRREREQRENLQRAAREQTHKQAIALELVRDYNHRLNNLPKQVNSNSNQPVQATLPELHKAKISERFCYVKFNNPEQQWLHNQQIDIVCELADRKIFPKNTVGLQDFSDTVLETVALAHQANCKNLIKITKSLTELAQNFLALGKGLVQGGYNFVGNIVNAGSNLILHPVNTTKAVANNIANLTKNVAIGLLRILVILADSTDEHNPEGLRPYILAAQDYGHEHYQQFRNYVETVPRLQKFEQIGEFIGEQTLSFTANFLTGKTISVISDAALAAQLHQAMAVKKQADKAKPGKVTWLNKFGAPGKDVARTIGLVVAEEYELATLDGLVASFKNSPANNQTLFNHAEEYFKHNKSGKKAKRAPRAVKDANGTLQKVRIVNTMQRQEFFKKPNIKKNYRPIGNDGIWQKKPGASGLKNAEYLQWDHKHNEVEVYNKKKIHLGALDPQTEEYYKPAVIGRILDI